MVIKMTDNIDLIQFYLSLKQKVSATINKTEFPSMEEYFEARSEKELDIDQEIAYYLGQLHLLEAIFSNAYNEGEEE